MDRAQFRRCAHVGLTLIADDLIGKPKFLQQPQHTLGARIVEMMDREHGEFLPACRICGAWWCQPKAAKSRYLELRRYYPGVID